MSLLANLETVRALLGHDPACPLEEPVRREPEPVALPAWRAEPEPAPAPTTWRKEPR